MKTRSQRLLIPITITIVVFLFLSSCATTKTSDQAAQKQKLKELRAEKKYRETTIEMGDNYFKPQEIPVKPGTIVIWKHVGRAIHDVKWDGAQIHISKEAPSTKNDKHDFSSDVLKPGDIYVWLFTETGKYYYHCHFHGGPQSGQWGLITVKK
ncbi:MAG: plastocyanin/azurin family copper-binding protein [Acidimicrobiia bacterium]